MLIRQACQDDLPFILEIYNDVIVTSTAVYCDDLVNLNERRRWFDARSAQGYPVLVAEDAGAIAGFASFSDFRAWPGYRYTVEHSVHIRTDVRGCGYGHRLMEALVEAAAAMGKHVLIGGIDAANEASLRFHKRLGFEKVAHFREVGHKFGRWLDLVFMQRMLDQGLASHE